MLRLTIALLATTALMGCPRRQAPVGVDPADPSVVAAAATTASMREVMKQALPAETRGARRWKSDWLAQSGYATEHCRNVTWSGGEFEIRPEDAEELLDQVVVGMWDLVTSNGGSPSAHVRCSSYDGSGTELGARFRYAAPWGNGGSVDGRVEVWLTRPAEAPEAPYAALTVELVETVGMTGPRFGSEGERGSHVGTVE